jgi:hypothetical protein
VHLFGLLQKCITMHGPTNVKFILNVISKVTLCGDKLIMALEDNLLLHYLMAFFQMLLCVAIYL